MTADLSPAEAETLARIEAAPYAPEAAFFACDWIDCPLGAECCHAYWQAATVEVES